MSRDPVAVTGLGVVSGFGVGTAALWEALAAGRSAIGDFERFDHSTSRTHVAAEVPAGALPSAGARRERLSLADRFALAAAAEALGQAGLTSGLSSHEAGVFFGSSTGGMFEAEEFFRDHLAARRGRTRVGRLAAQPTSAPADAVARRFGVGGPVETVASACASATLALGQALEALRAHEVDIALAGGSDALCRLTFSGFNALRAVDPLPCRPFRAEREGMSIGEGAAVLVLERADSAAARGVEPLGWLAGVGASCDAYHMTAPDPGGEGISRAVRAALADAGVDARQIDFVNAHGTGTVHNDAAEMRMLADLFGHRLRPLPVTSTKGAVGHFLGAAGAIEALVTLLCLRAGAVHPTPGEGSVIDAPGLDLVTGQPRPLPGARRALSTNLAFGGSNAACVLLHPEAR